MVTLAAYAAILSTVHAAVAFWTWWRRDIYLKVYGFHPAEIPSQGGRQTLGVVVSNAGRRSVVVRRIRIEFLARKSVASPLKRASDFCHSSTFNPAMRREPVPGKPGEFTQVPNVLAPGEELWSPFLPISEYDPASHWIKVTAFARNSTRAFSDWIAPRDGGPAHA